MIPVSLSLTGFLSYRELAVLDFSGFELACIAGPNGAGKSSLLDAMTWVLFGVARKRDDSLINAQANAAEVGLVFEYEGNCYRIQRTKPRDKTALLEFHIHQPGSDTWKPLTERTLRETEARVQQTLRLDYDTFVNASFFLQGKADQFTQQKPGDRKRILGNILGLEAWETYRQRAADRRKTVEVTLAGLEGQVKEIAAELAEEAARKARYQQLVTELERASEQRKMQEANLENFRKIAATLAQQQKLVNALGHQAEVSAGQLADLNNRLAARRQERSTFSALLECSEQIRAAYASWQQWRETVEQWDQVAAHFREQEKRRQPPRDEINAARAALAQELQSLQAREAQMQAVQAEVDRLHVQLERAAQAVSTLEEQLAQRGELEAAMQAAVQRRAEAKAENPRLKKEMDELKERMDRLAQAEGADCPLCGQPIDPLRSRNLLEKLQAMGTEMGDRYRANLAFLKQVEEQAGELEQAIHNLARAEKSLRTHAQNLAQLTNRHEMLQEQLKTWETVDRPRLQDVARTLEKESFAPEARARLAEIETELKAIGYDVAAHEAARQAEQAGRQAEAQLRALEQAQAALGPLQREISTLEEQIAALQETVKNQQKEYQALADELAQAMAGLPDLAQAERDVMVLRSQENRLRMETGAARQKVEVLDDLKKRRQRLEARGELLRRRVGQYKQLERAFGKDGVPALLIEQALPQIEAKANEILERLTGGGMSVRFITQAAYKDKKRDDLKETLDIQISDSYGTRDYEMYSGGEAFRANFAIRLALSEVLAQRAGARLQTLVIDEGFGSQDALGRQRLVQAINQVRGDFAKILVITHIDELKDAFPNRIEVEKTTQGSSIRVI